MKKITRYFLQGLLYVAPITITFYILYQLFRLMDEWLQSFISAYLPFDIPGVGILLLFILLTLLGLLGHTFIARPIRFFFKRIIDKTPLVKLIYSSLNELLSAFVGKERKFNRPVLVKINTVSSLEKIGFLTQEDLSHLNVKDKVAVYCPHSYNFSGELFIVPVDHIIPLDIPPSDAMKFVVSGGVTKV